jgi:hypothetical protein
MIVTKYLVTIYQLGQKRGGKASTSMRRSTLAHIILRNVKKKNIFLRVLYNRSFY